MRGLRPYLIAIALSVGLAISNGLARFAYGLILPSMKADLGLNYSDAGWLNTTNGVGYLIGALLTYVLIRFVSPARLFQFGVVSSAVVMLLMGATRDLDQLAALRLASGLCAAPVMICGGVLVSAIFVHAPDRARIATGLFFGGAGAGLLLSGIVVPALFQTLGARAWPTAWMLLGLISVAAAPFALWGSTRVPAPPEPSRRVRWPWYTFLPALAAYACFGAGYIVYMTFVVVWAAESGASLATVIALWVALGASTMIAMAFWTPLLPFLTHARPVAATLFMSALGTVIALFGNSPAALIASAAFFGFGFFMVPSSITSLIRQSLPREAWGGALSAFTVVFAIAQMVGPFAAGWLADDSKSLAAGLALGAALLLAGSLIALLQRAPRDPVHALEQP